MKKLACLFLLLAASGCPDVKTDGDETASEPIVEFDPANRIIPFPNNLLLNPVTGKVNLPEQCGETATTKALREGVLNKLDGFGLFEAALTVTFSEGVDPMSLMGQVVLYKRASGTAAVDPASAMAIPVVTQVTTTVRFDAGCATPSTVPQLIIIPRVPLEQKATYVVGLLEGIKTVGGAPFQPSGTWRLIREEIAPVTVENGVVVADRTPLDPSHPEDLERLLGIDLLWKAHAPALKFLSEDLPADKRKPREQLLLAWEFKTQTSTDPLDPAVAGSPASEVDRTMPLVDNTSLPGFVRANPPFTDCAAGDSDVQCFLKIRLGGGSYAMGDAACQQVACAAIGDVVGSGLLAKQYQVDTPNSYTGTGAKPIPGPWGDAIDPAFVKSETIGVFSLIPATPAPAAGYPVVVFQHALGRGRSDALAIAGRLAGLGFATVAIDAVAHDSRAVRVSSDAARLCGDVATSTRPDKGPSPLTAPQCYAPFLSTNLAATRDGIRQTILDQQRLVAALKACGTTACGTLQVDPAHMLYLGQSLGGVLGGMTIATVSDLKAAVLNVPAVGWARILENTQTLKIRCLLVDGLIDAGVLQGEKSNLLAMPPTGLCTTEAWKMQPGYRQFSVIGRWILDPADPANFTRRLATRRLLIQEVVGDTVMPNVATEMEGALLGLMPALADRQSSLTGSNPSAAIATNPNSTKFVQYPMLAPDAGMMLPGNTFHHGSLLSPTPDPLLPPTTEGVLGTIRMQIDALTYLSLNQ